VFERQLAQSVSCKKKGGGSCFTRHAFFFHQGRESAASTSIIRTAQVLPLGLDDNADGLHQFLLTRSSWPCAGRCSGVVVSARQCAALAAHPISRTRHDHRSRRLEAPGVRVLRIAEEGVRSGASAIEPVNTARGRNNNARFRRSRWLAKDGIETRASCRPAATLPG